MPKNWCFEFMVLEKTLEYPLVYKEIQPDNPKGNQLCVFIGRTDSPPSQPTSVRISSVLGDTKGRLIGPKLYFAPPTYYSIASFL